MKSITLFAAILAVALTGMLSATPRQTSPAAPATSSPDFAALKAEAERYFVDGSYAKAAEVYRSAKSLSLTAADQRWVEFRIADTSWRSQAATETSDSTTYEAARSQLETLINAIKRSEDRDTVWAEASESLADFWWARRDSQNWGGAWPHYSNALDWWAGSSDLEPARARYLAIAWKMIDPPWMQRGYYHYYWGVPIEVLDNVLKIAVNPNDKSRAQFAIAMMLRQRGGDWRSQLRIGSEFDGAISAGKDVDWYDDALFNYGQWLMSEGRPTLLDNGQWTRQPDFVGALAIFQRLVREFRKGETQYFDNAQQAIRSITDPVVSAGVSNIFLPGSEIQYALGWRNVKQIELTLHKVDVTRDLAVIAEHGPGNWFEDINLGAAEKLRSWTKTTDDKGDYRPGQSEERLDPTLETGAYLLTATAEGKTSKTMIFVTDAALVLKVSGDQALTFSCDALNSAPLPNATVRIWRFNHNDNRWNVVDATKQSDDSGLCLFGKDDFPALRDRNNVQYFAAATINGRPAFATTNGTGLWQHGDQWRIYAFTDRPAYRPGETVQWKLIARTPTQNGFTTPANQSIEYQINDPRGTKIKEGSAQLNAFGSAWGSVDVSAAMPLGEYQVIYWTDKEHKHHIGSATLFRLEEYKLPEFKVAVSTPLENGKRKSYVLGETIEANIQADYYFGGPVANATVEVVVYQNAYYRWWTQPREYPWLYEDNNPYRYWGGNSGQVLKRETLKTDAEGKAVLKFDAPENAGQDLEFRIEARVTDASRREIVANESVKVTQQRYYVTPRAKHNLYLPGDTAEIDFTAMDANDQPVQVEGSVKVTREEWIEIWIDPTGREVTGDELLGVQKDCRMWPPPPPTPFAPPWRAKFRGYKSEEILVTTVKLNEKGEATFSFTPQSIGFYRVTWFSKDMSPVLGAVPITAETAVWVATHDIARLGYRSGGVEIIVDKDTVRAGQSLPIMISTPTNDRYVLFSVEGDNLYSYQVIHVTGNVKLVQVPIDQRHIPNVYLSAITAHNGQLHQDQEQIVVPPVQQYLNVEVASDKVQYQPGDEGHFTITTKDHDGKPVSTEVALAVVDEAVTYIQQDYAGDPRAFFFDRKQSLFVNTGSTFQHNAYIRLVKGEKDVLIDERLHGERADDAKDMDGNELYAMNGARRESSMTRGRGGGGGGGGSIFAGVADAVAEGMPAPASASAPGGAVRLGMELQSMSKAGMAGQPAIGGGTGGLGEGPAIVVRSDFRSTLLWQPSVITDETGVGKLSLNYADSLTTWKATARAAGTGQQFGIGNASTRTKMPLIARLQAPRFFLVGDTVTVSGVINNNTDEVQSVTPSLEAEGLTIAAMMIGGSPVRTANATVDVPANGEARVDWQINVESAGTAKLKLIAKSAKYADAMEKTYTVYEHGVEKFIAKSGKVRGNDITVSLDIPSARKADSTVLMVQVSPSMAVTMLDALSYLIDYPYGCTEQTMSRFLPAAITAKTLNDLGIKPEVAMSKVFGGIEQEHADKTHPKGKKDLSKLDEITQASLDRLYGFQHGDGGWGWWKEGDSDHFMSAYVLWGLCLAKDAGLDVRMDVVDRAAAYLDKELIESETQPDLQAWILHALASHHATAKSKNVGEFQAKALDNLWKNRDKLNAYTRSLVALSAHQFGDAAKAKTLVENLLNGVKRDDRPDASVLVKGVEGPNQAVIGTAHWGEDGIYWRWSDGGVESTAFALRAMLAIDPKNPLIEPVTNWIVKNRRGSQWSNTRDTAIVVLALNDYLRSSGELTPSMEYELLVNGTSVASKKLSAEDVFASPSRYEIDSKLIRDGANDIRIVRKSGSGSIYFAAEATYFSLEEPVPPAGNEIFVRRSYYKLVPRPTLLKGYVYDRVPLMDGGTVNSGERVEVVMTVEAKNNYEYLVFEDLKPAGLEAVAVRSGEPMYTREMKSGAVNLTFGKGDKTAEAVSNEQAQSGSEDYTGRNRWVYQELRDRQVAMFIDKLPEGVWELRYDLRAETPGKFHALPVMGHAMYVPEIRCNSGEVRITVLDAQEK